MRLSKPRNASIMATVLPLSTEECKIISQSNLSVTGLTRSAQPSDIARRSKLAPRSTVEFTRKDPLQHTAGNCFLNYELISNLITIVHKSHGTRQFLTFFKRQILRTISNSLELFSRQNVSVFASLLWQSSNNAWFALAICS